MDTKLKYRAVVGGLVASGLFLIGTSSAVAASTGDVGPFVLTTSPSDVVWETIDAVFGEVADIGTAILFAYGFIHLVKLGTDSGETSGSVRKMGLSWGLGIAIQSWAVFQSFVKETGNDIAAEETVAPLITEYGVDALVALSYVPV